MSTPESVSQAPEEILPIDEIIRRRKGETIIMEIHGYDEYHNPSSGRVVASWSSEPANDDSISTTLSQLLAESKGQHTYYLFKANKRVTSGPEFERAIAELGEKLQSQH